MENDVTKVVKAHDVRIDSEYVQWLSEVKARYRNARIKAAVKVNAEQLLFNWQLGRDLVTLKAERKWGAGVVEQISMDMQAAFPDSKGFSVSNLWRMKQWYSFYSPYGEKLAQVGRDLKLAQVGRESLFTDSEDETGVPFPDFFAFVPWRHHVEIVTRSESIDEALFYIIKTIEGAWSRNTLMNFIKADYYHSSGGALTNFSQKISPSQRALAQSITKDTYDFGFLSLDAGYKEEALETELERHLTRFLLELGTGFAYLGRQRQIIVSGKTRKLDMLFYHIHLRCYIVIELKTTPFQPEYAGKLNFYVNAVNHLMKGPDDNPTIGLLICSNKDETEVRYAFEAIQNPMGVSSFTNVQAKRIQDQLPSIEELKKRIRMLEEERDNP